MKPVSYIRLMMDDSFAPVVLSSRSKAKEINPGCALCTILCGNKAAIQFIEIFDFSIFLGAITIYS